MCSPSEQVAIESAHFLLGAWKHYKDIKVMALADSFNNEKGDTGSCKLVNTQSSKTLVFLTGTGI